MSWVARFFQEGGPTMYGIEYLSILGVATAALVVLLAVGEVRRRRRVAAAE